jgi:hypothetical protein
VSLHANAKEMQSSKQETAFSPSIQEKGSPMRYKADSTVTALKMISIFLLLK